MEMEVDGDDSTIAMGGLSEDVGEQLGGAQADPHQKTYMCDVCEDLLAISAFPLNPGGSARAVSARCASWRWKRCRGN